MTRVSIPPHDAIRHYSAKLDEGGIPGYFDADPGVCRGARVATDTSLLAENIRYTACGKNWQMHEDRRSGPRLQLIQLVDILSQFSNLATFNKKAVLPCDGHESICRRNS
jgi:hypothetical protein